MKKKKKKKIKTLSQIIHSQSQNDYSWHHNWELSGMITEQFEPSLKNILTIIVS